MKKILLLALACIILVIMPIAGSGGQQPAAPSGPAAVNVMAFSLGTSANWPAFTQIMEKLGNLKINLIESPTVNNDYYLKVMSMLYSGDNSVDVYRTDEVQAISYSKAGYLEPIDDCLTPAIIADLDPAFLNTICRYNGKIYSIYTDPQPTYFFYNKALFDANGLKPPTNQAEFLAVAKALTKDGKFGFGEAYPSPGALSNTVTHWVNKFGGDMFNWRNPGNAKALQWMYDLLYDYKVISQASHNDRYVPLIQKFVDGEYAMIFAPGGMMGSMGSKLHKELQIAPSPTFVTNHTWGATWLFSVSAYGSNKTAAKTFIKTLLEPEAQRNFLNFDSQTCARLSIMKEPAILEKFPSLKYLAQYTEAKSLVPRPIFNNPNGVADGINTNVSLYLTQQRSLEQTLNELQKLIDDDKK